MSSSIFTKMKVGFTTILALTMLFGGILWVKNYNPATKKIRLAVIFDNGRDIYNGDPVKISGIKIGEVTEISLTEDTEVYELDLSF